MFSDEILERIFVQEDVQRICFEHQSIIIHAVERVLEEMGVVIEYDAISESES